MSVTTEDLRIDGPHGALPLRVYAPTEDDHTGYGLVWAHGGAWMSGDLDMPENDWVARRLAEHGIAVVTVDYRLAPYPAWIAGKTGLEAVTDDRFHYPVASEETVSAFQWAISSDSRVGADGWALGGASAGADLAAGAALRLRDTGGPTPRALLLAYPVVHAELPEMPAELAAKVHALPPESTFPPQAVSALARNYVGDPAALQKAYAFPGGHDLTGLPPTFILNCDADSLRASGQAFGAELAAAGVDLVMIREDGVRHGHLNEPDNPGAARSITRMAHWLTTPSLIGTAHERQT